jgi:hypothetical protein
MPTLNNKNTFSFHGSVKLSQQMKQMIENNTAIDIILSIIETKLQKASLSNRTYFFKGRTGSGKSTLFISKLFKHFNSSILVSEPRILLVSSNANIIETYNPELSSEINKITSNFTMVETTHRSITMMTTAVLYMQLLNILMLPIQDQVIQLKRFKFIIIDEVHMIDIHVIRLLYVCKEILKKHSDRSYCPLFIFQSATIDIRTLIFYIFDVNDESTYKKLIKDPYLIGYVKGESNFEVKEEFITDMYRFNDSKDSFSKIISNYVYNLPPPPEPSAGKDVLVIVPLIRLIDDILNSFPSNVFKITRTTKSTQLSKWRQNNYNKSRTLAIGYARDYSTLSDEIIDQLTNIEKLSDEVIKNETHIIIATPILDTGITLPFLYYCVDLGLHNTVIFKPLTMELNNVGQYFKQIPISVSNSKQRVGRLGRVNKGHFIHFYSKQSYKKFIKTEIPETINNFSISPTLLSQMRQVTTTPQTFDLINSTPLLFIPSTDILLNSIRDLIYAGYLTASSIYLPIQSYISDVWESNAIFMHLHLHIPLFKALLMCSCNRRFIFPSLNPKYLENMKFDSTITLRSDTAPAIRRARNVLTSILHDPASKTPYIKEHVWN